MSSPFLRKVSVLFFGWEMPPVITKKVGPGCSGKVTREGSKKRLGASITRKYSEMFTMRRDVSIFII